MSYITWITPKGNLGTVPEGEFFEFPLNAIDNAGDPVSYYLLSGKPPVGVQCTLTGFIKGTPIVSGTVPITTRTSSFTIRAISDNGALADRTFDLTVSNIKPPEIVVVDSFIGSYFDGSLFYHKFEVVDPDPAATFTWSIASGTIPEGVTLNDNGELSGFIYPLPIDSDFGVAGYDASPSDKYPYDFVKRAKDIRYTFTVRVNDGISSSTHTFQLSIVAKTNFTADNDVYLINNTGLTVDNDNKYVPVILNTTYSIPDTRVTDQIQYKLESYTFNSNSVTWEAVDLPPFLTLNPTTGWITGQVPAQNESVKEHKFYVKVYDTEYPIVSSPLTTFTLRTLGDSSNIIVWNTPADLGMMENGSVSEYSISAYCSTGVELIYKLSDYPYCNFPQGLTLQEDGLITGRSTFRYFSLDGRYTILTLNDTSGIKVGDAISGLDIPSGAKVLEILDEYRVKATPAVVSNYGTEITFTHSDNTEVVKLLSKPSSTTTFDKNTTTFDNIKKFTITAQTADGYVSDTKTFTIKIDNYNSLPYENIYVRAFPRKEQRDSYKSVINNQSIFPDEIIYRASDPWFGRQTELMSLFLAGLNPSLLSTYMASIVGNHYLKRIDFGNIKTARALDSNFNVKYEVVYIDLLDSAAYQNSGTPQSVVDLHGQVKNPHEDSDGNIYWQYKPNSNELMRNDVRNSLGFSNQGALPDWMTSIQQDGSILGLTDAIVMAYVKPGTSELASYRAKLAGLVFNDIDFTIDRYQLDNVMTEYFDVANNVFYGSRETTFDRLVEIDVANIIDVDYAIESQTFDQINGRSVEYLSNNFGIDGIKSWKVGQTLVFARQENYPNPSRYNEGWNYAIDLYLGRTGYGVLSYDESSVVTGYMEHSSNPLIENRRGGIWKITVDSDGIVWLDFVQQIEINQIIRVSYGFSHGNSRLIYSSDLEGGLYTVPHYIVYNEEMNNSGQMTRFDSHGTKFIDLRDKQWQPKENDKYIKYPYYGALDLK